MFMIHRENKGLLWPVLARSIMCALIVIAPTVRGKVYQQVTDGDFDPKVLRPAYTMTHPRVMIDAAHKNFHTAEGNYKTFARLIASDGYEVVSNKEKFQADMLKG